MYAQVEKPKENKCRSVANSVAQKNGNGKQGFEFVDNREFSKDQRILQTITNNSFATSKLSQKNRSQPIGFCQRKGSDYVMNRKPIIQRVINVDDTRISKYTYKSQILKGKFVKEWSMTPKEIQTKIMDLISEPKVVGTFKNWNELLKHFGIVVKEESIEEELSDWKNKSFMKDEITINFRLLSDKGGYHAVWEIAETEDYVLRTRKNKDATTISAGLKNWMTLKKNLETSKEKARVPELYNFDTVGEDQAYIVEKISHEVDAHDLWLIMHNTMADEVNRKAAESALLTIQALFNRNINAMLNNKIEPFPDFRPSNVGVKDDNPEELILFDFDQPGEKQERGTLIAHAMEWAGRRFIKDEGGARDPNEKLWNFLTGGKLGEFSKALKFI